MSTTDSTGKRSTALLKSSLKQMCFALAVTGCLTGCASSGIVSDIQTSTVPRQVGNNGTYQLSKAERELPCNKINGRIQLRILHLRHMNAGDKPSQVSQAMRQTTNTIGVWSAPNTAAAPKTRARDLALLQAYNRRLAELKCPTFDINADLANTDINHIPSPKR